jgi:hypothetical protein
MVCPRPNGNRLFGPVHRLALEAGEVRGYLRQPAGHLPGGLCVVTGAGGVGYRALHLRADQDLDHAPRYPLARSLAEGEACLP